MDFRSPKVISALAANKVYVTVKERDPAADSYVPHTVRIPSDRAKVMIEDGSGVFCPTWGEDLEHLDYYLSDSLNVLHVRDGSIITSRRLLRGTRCFIMPLDVCALVAQGKATELSLLKDLLRKAQ